jgi:hypothetical protein
MIIIWNLQIGNCHILKAFKNNLDRFLVFWTCFKKMIQHQKYVELVKKNGMMDTTSKYS